MPCVVRVHPGTRKDESVVEACLVGSYSWGTGPAESWRAKWGKVAGADCATLLVTVGSVGSGHICDWGTMPWSILVENGLGIDRHMHSKTDLNPEWMLLCTQGRLLRHSFFRIDSRWLSRGSESMWLS